MSLRWKLAQWFEKRWWRNYLKGKNPDEYLHWKKKYWTSILDKVVDVAAIDPSKTICDIGCGPAGIFIALPGCKITAVDPLIEEYEKAIPFFKKKNFPNTAFVTERIESFHSTEKFDLVFCMNAINHVQDIEMALDNLKNLCLVNVRVILSVDANNFPAFKYLFHIVPIDILHPHQYNLREYVSLLENRNMKIVKTEMLKQGTFFNHYLLVAELLS